MPPSEAEPRRTSRLKRNGNGTGEEETRGRRKPASESEMMRDDPDGVGETVMRLQTFKGHGKPPDPFEDELD